MVPTAKEVQAADASFQPPGAPEKKSYDFSKDYVKEEIPLTEISKNIEFFEGELPKLERVKTNKVYPSEDGQFSVVPTGISQTFGTDRIQILPTKDIPKDKIGSDGKISRSTLIEAGNVYGESPTLNWTVGDENKGKYKKIGLSRIIGIDESGQRFEYSLFQTSGPNYLGNQTEFFYVIGWKEKQDGKPPRLEICKIIEIVHGWEPGKTVYKYYPVSNSPNLRSFAKKMTKFIKVKIEKPSGGRKGYAEMDR